MAADFESLPFATLRTRVRPDRKRRLRVLIPLTVLVVFVGVASVGFCVLDSRYSFSEALYMTIISVTTTGFREIHEPNSPLTVAWTALVIVGGLVAGAVVLSLIVGMIVEGQIRRILGRRQLERKISSLSGHVIVCGYGAMGTLVASELKAAGRDVVVIDSSPERTAAAEENHLLYIVGDAQTDEALQDAGVARASVLIAALPSDAENVFLTLTARQASTDLRIIARAQNTWAQDKLKKAGATRVICPQVIGASRIADVVLRPAVVDFVEMAHKGVELELDQLKLGERSELVGKTLEELALPRRIGAYVVAVRRSGGKAIYHPHSKLKLEANDTLILIGKRGAASAVEKIQLKQQNGSQAADI